MQPNHKRGAKVTDKMLDERQKEDDSFMLKNVRLSFPALFTKSKKSGKYEATFYIPKDDEKTKAIILRKIKKALADNKDIKIARANWCFKDGDEGDREEAFGFYTFKASNKKKPQVLNRSAEVMEEDDDSLFYGGAWVNAIVGIWIQNNEFGKRVNANLFAVQFVKHDEPFGEGSRDYSDKFEDLGDDEEADEDFDDEDEDL